MKTNQSDFVHTIDTDLDACEAWIEEERRKNERARRHRGRKNDRQQHERGRVLARPRLFDDTWVPDADGEIDGLDLQSPLSGYTGSGMTTSARIRTKKGESYWNETALEM